MVVLPKRAASAPELWILSAGDGLEAALGATAGVGQRVLAVRALAARDASSSLHESCAVPQHPHGERVDESAENEAGEDGLNGSATIGRSPAWDRCRIVRPYEPERLISLCDLFEGLESP